MAGPVEQWIESHKRQSALAGAAVAVVVLALHSKSQKAKAAASSGAISDTSGNVAVPAGGGVGVPGLNLGDVQNAVQGQVNDDLAAFRNQVNQQIARNPGPVGKTGKTGAPGASPTMYSINVARARRGESLLSVGEYRAQYPHGRVENHSETVNIGQHVSAFAAVQANNAKRAAAARKPPPPAPKPKPKPPVHKVVVGPKVVTKR